MRIGEAARAAGVAPATLRYYERRGLIQRAPRTSSGYRTYGPEAVAQLRLVRWAQGLGFTLREVRELSTALARHAQGGGPVVRARLQQKVSEIDARIADLNRLRDQLADLASCACEESCPVVAAAAAGLPL